MNRTQGSHLLGSFAIFVTMLLISSTMLFIALLLWLAQLLGSLILALLIVGVAAGVVAFALYFGRVRPEMMQLREELATIYEVAAIMRTAYRWLATLLRLL